MWVRFLREQLVKKRRRLQMQPSANTSMYLAVNRRKICREDSRDVLRKTRGETVQWYHGDRKVTVLERRK